MQARQKPQPRLRDMWEILKTGVPSAVQGAVFCFANIFVQASVNGFGEVAIAGSTVAMNFEYFTYYVITAFGQTATTFTGQNHVAGQKERCRKILRLWPAAIDRLQLRADIYHRPVPRLFLRAAHARCGSDRKRRSADHVYFAFRADMQPV